MIKDKLIVILFYVYSSFGFSHKYCEICSNHTLCLFLKAGPSISCVKYNKNNILTQEEIKSIVDRINSKRNFIALGRSKNLPGAANMKKIVWSDELAIFAQRWVDQCDPSTRPDKEDLCRNTESTEVGQNIATLSDLSLNFNVASFIEVWFMESLDYSGSVTYYNESDNRTRYFTQLIWANTGSVGCGQIANVRKVQRLVCNFAPNGNIPGKPVYIIGYPATQCPEDMTPDDHFKGLCTYNTQATKLTSQISPVSSLLRIINLSNNTDLLLKNKTTSKVKSRKLTTLFINNTHAAVKRYPQHNFWEKSTNHSKLRDHNIHQVENPWRVYDGYESQNNFNLFTKKTEPDIKKYESVLTFPSFNKQDSRKLKQESSCTRKTKSLRNNCENINERTDECTRGQKNECWTDTSQNLQATSPFVYSICSCNSYTATTQRTTAWIGYCQCLKNNRQINCSNTRRIQDEFINVDSKNYGTFYNYDLLPNLHVREGIGRENVKNKLSTHAPAKGSFDLVDLYKGKGYNPFYRQRHKRSDNRFTTIMPFWQMDDTLPKKTFPFKTGIRYTTLPNKKLKHTKIKSVTTSIEPITLTTTSLNREFPSITEKYLSFDELMQLRNKGGDARRQGAGTTKATTIAATTTKEITANTPFLRMKHCTRKLTCTWTVAQMTDCNGSVIFDHDGNNRGSRTPPGYVDGCTRTSTCTRDYMDRNKLGSSTEDSDNVITTTEIDDDYCERRVLEIRRRNSREQSTSNYNNLDKVHSLDTSYKMKKLTSILSDKRKDRETSECFCYNLAGRAKRDDTRNKNYPLIYNGIIKRSKKIHNENIYYGELYYKVLRKIRETWDKNKKRNQLRKCFCNGSLMRDNYRIVFYLMLSGLIIFT